MKSYLQATYFLCDLLEDRIDGKVLKGSDSTYISAILSFTGLVTLDWIDETVETKLNVCKNKRFPFYRVQPFLADILARLAESDEHVYDYCVNLCSTNSISGMSLPYTLRVFASRVLGGDIARPTKSSRPIKKNWMEQLLLYHAALEVSKLYGLYLTRNDEGSNKYSACDAVAEALTICGRPTKYSEIKYLVVHPDRGAFRTQAEAFFKVSKRWGGISENSLILLQNNNQHWEDVAMEDVIDIWGGNFLLELLSPNDI